MIETRQEQAARMVAYYQSIIDAIQQELGRPHLRVGQEDALRANRAYAAEQRDYWQRRGEE